MPFTPRTGGTMSSVTGHTGIKPQPTRRPKTELQKQKREILFQPEDDGTSAQVQDCFTDQFGRGVKTDLAGIDNHVIQQRVVDVGIEVLP